MEYDPDKVLERMLGTPPRCISQFVTETVNSPEPWDFCNIVTWTTVVVVEGVTVSSLGYPLHNYNLQYNGTARLLAR